MHSESLLKSWLWQCKGVPRFTLTILFFWSDLNFFWSNKTLIWLRMIEEMMAQALGNESSFVSPRSSIGTHVPDNNDVPI